MNTKTICKITFIKLFTVIFSFGLFAQVKNIDLNAPIPVDPKIIIGKLDNGLTYYIRKNSFPEKEAQFWLTVNVGSILEEDHQDGLAHFCEHMAFNGTKNFEKHDIIHYLQSIGMKFGPEINAFTGTDVTNYMLQKVPIDVKENIDTSFNILYDWACNVSYEGEEIDNERGVIHEEWRSRRSANFRMRTKYSKVLYHGSKYAKRDVIGNINVIDSCEYEALISFYKEWYRPDLQAIIAVGDFDVKEIEEKIKKTFSTIPKRENSKERKIFPVPDHKETLVAIETDKEAQYSMVNVFYKHDVTTGKNNVNYYKSGILQQLYSIMINARIQELLLDENPPFLYGYSAYNENIVRSKDAYITIGVAKNNELIRTLKTMLIENERVKKYGFTATEFERSKSNLLSSIEKAYSERNKQKSSSFTYEYFSHFLTNDPIPGIEYEFTLIKQLLPVIKLEEVNVLAKKWITNENVVVVLTAPEKEGVLIPSKEEVLKAVDEVKNEKIEPYIDKVSDKPLISSEPVPGKIDKKSKDKGLGTVEWTFKNGVKVIIKATDFKDDEIRFTAYSLGGTSLYELKDDVSAGFAANVVDASGISEFDAIELEKKLAGKNIRVSPWISEIQEGISGSSTQDDFETMLQLVYLYFTKSRVDKKAFASFINRMKASVENRASDPSSAFRDTISATMSQNHPRRRPLSEELINEAKLNRIGYIFKDRFGDPGSFTFIFVGNLDIEKVKPLFEKYLGGLPVVNRTETWKDLNINPPKGVIKKTVYSKMEVPKSTVYVNYTGELEYNRNNRLLLTVLSDLLDIRYTESIREDQGGTYGISVRSSQTHYPNERYRFGISFECDPDKVDLLKGIVYAEIAKMKKEGPPTKELNGVIENKIKEKKENLKENRYWLNSLKFSRFHNEEIQDFEDFEKQVKGLTIEDIKNAAAKFLLDDNYVEIILMPKK